jgi:hypothetical protein
MKKLLVALFSFAGLSAYAQTADEIVQKYSTALGGLDAFNKVSTIKMTGNVTAQGMVLPLTTQMINNKAVRTDVEVMGNQIVNVYNNGTGWKINPYAGAESATELTGQELIEAKAQASLVNHLMDYKNRGHKIELTAQEDVEGVKCHKIILTNKDDNKATTYFINASDYMLVKSTGMREMQGQEMEVETFYSDFKEFNGLKFAMKRSQKIQGQVFQEIVMEKFEFGVTIDESIFKM